MHLGIDFLRILVDSDGQVGAMKPPKRTKTPQLGAQDGPEAAQETPKAAQEPPKSCLNGLQEAAQRCLGARSRPRGAQGPPSPRPDLDFGPFCLLFWIIFDGFFPPDLPCLEARTVAGTRLAALKI